MTGIDGTAEIEVSRGFAQVTVQIWRILRRLRCCPWRVGRLAKAIHVLQVREAKAG